MAKKLILEWKDDLGLFDIQNEGEKPCLEEFAILLGEIAYMIGLAVRDEADPVEIVAVLNQLIKITMDSFVLGYAKEKEGDSVEAAN